MGPLKSDDDPVFPMLTVAGALLINSSQSSVRWLNAFFVPNPEIASQWL